MFLSFGLLFTCLIGEIAARQGAPGAVNCTALQVGPKVITRHSCTTASSAPGTTCSFTCHHGYKLSGPPNKHCGINGSWTDEDVPVSCNDKNECNITNGFCSHICTNVPGSYHCSCPDSFYLDPKDQRTCKARGVQVDCEPNHMKIVLPKKLIHNLAHEHLSLLDPACKARGNASHYILSTNVTGCGTRSHEYKNFIVYTNMVIESPDDGTDVITHVGKNEIKVPFSCYYNDLEIVHAVGFQPTAEKIHVYVQGRGRYALSLDIFKDRTFGDGPNVRASQPKFTEADFPISVQLRERVHVQASLDTRETDLKIFLSNCCSTPTQDHEATIKFRHPLIVEGCPRDPSVKFHPSSDPTKVRFSFEAFKFLGDHDYVFVHCRVHVCDINDTNSRCAKGCMNGNRSVMMDYSEGSKNPVVKSVKIAPLHAATRVKLGEKPMPQSKRRAHANKIQSKPHFERNFKARGQAKLPAPKHVAVPAHTVMKRAAGQSEKNGVLGTADVSKGPFILEEDSRKASSGKNRLRKMSAPAKRSGIKKDVQPNKRLSVVPSGTNLLLVALTVASILALAGVAYLGRKAMKTAQNPFNYQTLVVN
ncbi:PREDICTED: uromodulin-like [Acropora digitifera]|uniref:uromodulin-like n=1 Tax=Acropora digitifera TaxID=70779 RepID=UPI00077A5961|nr:PREDICTED: uromodulin-like [Acropora digitifera]